MRKFAIAILLFLGTGNLMAASTEKQCKKLCSKMIDPNQCIEVCTTTLNSTSSAAAGFHWDIVIEVDEYCYAFHDAVTGEWDLACSIDD